MGDWSRAPGSPVAERREGAPGSAAAFSTERSGVENRAGHAQPLRVAVDPLVEIFTILHNSLVNIRFKSQTGLSSAWLFYYYEILHLSSIVINAPVYRV